MSKFNLMGPSSKSDVIPFNIIDFKRYYTMNTGNMLFFYACEAICDLGGGKFGWGADSVTVNNSSAGILLPMANQIGEHFNISTEGPQIENINVPIVAMGLGSQLDFTPDNFNRVPQGTKDWLKLLASKSDVPNISLRGENTYKFLKEMGLGGSAVVLGCPSLHINPEQNLGRKIKDKFIENKNKKSLFSNFSVAAGDPHHKDLNLSFVEKRLIRFVETYGGDYIVQNPMILIKLTNGWYSDINYEEYELIRKRWFNILTHTEIKEWFVKYARCFISIPQWIYHYSNRTLVVGTRIHGVQTAIQAGTPAVCICIDARTKELCQTMHIPYIDSDTLKSGFTENDIISVLDEWDFEKFDENRLNLANRTMSFLLANGASFSNKSLLGCDNE